MESDTKSIPKGDPIPSTVSDEIVSGGDTTAVEGDDDPILSTSSDEIVSDGDTTAVEGDDDPILNTSSDEIVSDESITAAERDDDPILNTSSDEIVSDESITTVEGGPISIIEDPKTTPLSNRGALWNPFEESALMKELDNKIPIAEIAKKHKRTEMAIKCRIVKIIAKYGIRNIKERWNLEDEDLADTKKIMDEQGRETQIFISNHGTEWTTQEEISLIDELNRGRPIVEIANIHSRTTFAIKCRAVKILLDMRDKGSNIKGIQKRWNIDNEMVQSIGRWMGRS